MIQTLRMGAIAAAALVFAPAVALADPVTWTLSGATFDDGGTASGSFVYDADTDTYSSVQITTTAGTQRSGTTFVDPIGLYTRSDLLYVATSGGAGIGLSSLYLAFDVPLTDAGGVIGIGGVEGTCTSNNCGAQGQPMRNITGSVIAVPAPPPPPPPPAVVPTLTEWAMVLLAGLLATTAALALGRRRLT